MSRYLDTSTEARMAKIMVQRGRPIRSSWAESVRSSSGLLWERQFEKVLLDHCWEKVFKLKMFICQTSKRTIHFSVCGRYQTGWEETRNIDLVWKILMKEVELGEPTSFLDHVHLGCTQRDCQISDDIVANYREICSNPGCWSQRKIPELQGNLMQKQYLLRSMTWKVMRRNVWKDIQNLRIKRLNNKTKSQRHAWMIINSKKKKMSQLESCPQFAHKLFWNVYIWLVLVDLAFCGLWTNLRVLSQNGQNLVTNDYAVWSLTFIIHVNTNSIVMWEILLNNADWDCFKTPILQEILKTQYQHQEVSYVLSEVTRLCHTEAEIISLDAGLRMDGIPALTLCDLVFEVFHSVPKRTDGPKRATGKPVGNCQAKHGITRSQSSTPTSFQQTLITFHQIQRILVLVLCCVSLRTMRR